jgi:uncharacterized membrane protein required for colicin V production
MIVVAVMYYLTEFQEEDWWQESLLIPQVLQLIEWVRPLIFNQANVLLNTLGSGNFFAGSYQASDLMVSGNTGLQPLSIL